jgi:transposase
MEYLSSEMEQQNQLEWRRGKVQELYSKGYSQKEISQVLQVGLVRNQTKTNIKNTLMRR